MGLSRRGQSIKIRTCSPISSVALPSAGNASDILPAT